jgi:hypothetical protein
VPAPLVFLCATNFFPLEKELKTFRVSKMQISASSLHAFLYFDFGRKPCDLTVLEKLPNIVLGLPDFIWCMTPKPEKMSQMNTKCTKGS